MSRIFTLEQAQALIPRVREITKSAVDEVEDLMAWAGRIEKDDPDHHEIAARIQATIRDWTREIEHIGAEAKGLWLVDFDNGDGYWCWKHPEELLDHCHSYDEGFAGRRPIEPEVLH